MAKNVDIVEAKKGVIYKYVISTVKGNYSLNTDKGKSNYLAMLLENENRDICLIGYCLLNTHVYIIVKGASKKMLDEYVKAVNKDFYTCDGQNGYPFRPTVERTKISNKNLQKQINIVHQFAPSCDPASYPFCSLSYLKEGKTDAIMIIKNATKGADMSLQDFENAMSAKVKAKQKSMQEYEKYSVVMAQAQKRYLSQKGLTSENNIMYIMGEVCDRTTLSYKKVAKKMSINPKRRDMLIGVICDMIIRRKYTIDTVIAKLELIKENKTGLILEVIAELNRIYNYSYDYILSIIGISDYSYNLLAILVKGINEQYGEEFETICMRFHLQNEIIPLRQKCGL